VEYQLIEVVAGCLYWETAITAGRAGFGHLLLLVLAIRADENS
jgi:hypothetical protein